MRQRCRITQGWKTKNQGQGTKIHSTTQPVLRRNEEGATWFYVVELTHYGEVSKCTVKCSVVEYEKERSKQLEQEGCLPSLKSPLLTQVEQRIDALFSSFFNLFL